MPETQLILKLKGMLISVLQVYKFSKLNFKTKSFLSCHDIFFFSFSIRGDFIVPNMDEAFPKKKEEKADEKDSSVGFGKDITKRSPFCYI